MVNHENRFWETFCDALPLRTHSDTPQRWHNAGLCSWPRCKHIFAGDRDRFELLKEDIRESEAEADRKKRNIRAHLPASILMPVDKSVFFSFLREADKVVDCIKNALYWMS